MRRQRLPFRRAERIGVHVIEELRNLVGYELADPRASTTEITRVEVADDLKSARVWYRISASDEDDTDVAHMLERASTYLANALRETLDLRYRMDLHFRFDAGLINAERIERALATVTPARLDEPPDSDANDEDAPTP